MRALCGMQLEVDGLRGFACDAPSQQRRQTTASRKQLYRMRMPCFLRG